MEKKKGKKSNCYLITENKNYCTGCSACVQACPKKCISLKSDEEGFYYPVIDKSKCVNCSKCLITCPVVNEIKQTNLLIEEEVFGYCTSDEKNLLSSSSGGAFSDLTISFCKNFDKIAVFGAKFDDNLNVIHDYVTNIRDIDCFRKSKYVQSYIGNSYIKAKEFLNKGYRVVFSGTPCQIAGLKKYLNRQYDNLLCIDIICHGTPSQKLFDIEKKICAEKYNSKIKNINFREKKQINGKYSSKNIKFNLKNGNIIIEDSNSNAYLKGFQNALFYRPSCYSCKFASTKRYSDITIADCWGIEKVDKNIDFHKGYSCIVIHTKNGKNLFNKCMDDGNYIKLDLDFVIKNNSHYSKPAKNNGNRQKFFSELNEKNFDELVNKYTKLSLYFRIKRKIKHIVNNLVK